MLVFCMVSKKQSVINHQSSIISHQSSIIMNIIKTSIPGVLIIEPRVFKDSRGYFFESFSQREFDEPTNEARAEPSVLELCLVRRRKTEDQR